MSNFSSFYSVIDCLFISSLDKNLRCLLRDLLDMIVLFISVGYRQQERRTDVNLMQFCLFFDVNKAEDLSS